MLKGNNYICSLKIPIMKLTKFFLFNFYLIISASHFAQTVLINENFDSGNLTGWTLIDGDMATVNNDPQVSLLPNSFHLVVDYDSVNTTDSVLAATSWFSDTNSASNFLGFLFLLWLEDPEKNMTGVGSCGSYNCVDQ